MADMDNAEVTAVLKFDGEELTEEELADIETLIYIDNDDEHADDLQILAREGSLLSGVHEISLTLQQEGWHGTNMSKSVSCGVFSVDDRESRFVQGAHIVKAAAITAISGIRQTPRNQAWERFNLKEIATEIAARHGTGIIYAARLNPVFARKEQINKSDIRFLSELCRTVGLRLKFTRNALVIYSPYEYGEYEPMRTFKKGDAEIIEDRLHHKKNDTDYAQCRVTYRDPIKKEVISYTYSRGGQGRKLEVRQKVSSVEEARNLAICAMKEKNCKEYTGCIVCDGDIMLSTGSVIALSGYGEYDRKYVVTKAIHNVQGGTYTSKIFFETVLEGYDG